MRSSSHGLDRIQKAVLAPLDHQARGRLERTTLKH
jgi:hypothetical protein